MDPAEQHRSIAADFGELIANTPEDAWQNQTPVAEWKAIDVVSHLVDWFPGFLAGGTDLELPEVTPVTEDPVAAWTERSAAVQQILQDDANADVMYSGDMLPEMPLGRAVSQFYTADIFMHSWDLAKGTGQEIALDEEMCQHMVEGMAPMEGPMRASGQFGPKVEVPDDASWQDRLIGFIGRDPRWSPDA